MYSSWSVLPYAHRVVVMLNNCARRVGGICGVVVQAYQLWAVSVESYLISYSLWNVPMTQSATCHVLLHYSGMVPRRFLLDLNSVSWVSVSLSASWYSGLVAFRSPARLGDSERRFMGSVFDIPSFWIVTIRCWTLITLYVAEVCRSNLFYRIVAISLALSHTIAASSGQSTTT